MVALLPERKGRLGGPGRPPYDVRRVLKGILSLIKRGCQWRMLPRECGNWRTREGYCKRWRREGVWARLRAALRHLERRRLGRQPEPAAGSGDSQSSKTATQGSEGGCEGGKKIPGRTRQLLVDTLGLRLAVVVTAADTEARQGLGALLPPYFAGGVKRRRQLWGEGGYRAQWVAAWVRSLKQTPQITREITEKEGKGFQVIPWRWAVERTFAWLVNDRRHSRDYERLTATREAMIQISMIRLLLKRLA